MRALLFAAIAVCVASCGGPECERSDRSGLYQVSYEKTSGNCNDLPSVLVRVDGSEVYPNNCTVALDEWSASDCRRDTDATCIQTDGTTMTMVGFTEQTDDEGDRLEGKATLQVSNTGSGAVICTATYKTKAVRQ